MKRWVAKRTRGFNGPFAFLALYFKSSKEAKPRDTSVDNRTPKKRHRHAMEEKSKD